MRHVRRWRERSNVVLAAITFVAGFVASALFELAVGDVLSTYERAATVVLLLLLVIALFILLRFNHLERRLDGIVHTLGVRYEFVWEPLRGTGKSYRRNREIVASARERVLVLHYSREHPGGEQDAIRRQRTAEHREEQRRYSRVLTHLIEERADPDFCYTRIIQSPEGRDGPVREDEIGTFWMNHCREMLAAARRPNRKSNVRLMKSDVYFENTVILVDHRYVILIFEAMDPWMRVYFAQALLVIEDRDGSIVRYFDQVFEEALAQARSLTSEADLITSGAA